MKGVHAKAVRRWGRLLLMMGLLACGCSVAPAALATCVFQGTLATSGGSGAPVWFDPAIRVLANNKVWFENPRQPVPQGTYLGIVEGMLIATICTDLRVLARQYVDMVYIPPANATRLGANGYRMPTDNPAISMDIEFSGATPNADGLFLRRSTDTVSTSGSGSIGGFSTPAFQMPVKISLVKTGAFSATAKDEVLGRVNNKNFQMGTFRYVSASNPGLMSPTVDAAQVAGAPLSGPIGYVGVPHCDITPRRPDENNLGLVEHAAVVTLAPISAARFRGIGPVDDGLSIREVILHCWGLPTTTPELYFETAYPSASGDGVGMPSANSDIGVQVLLGATPIRFGTGIPIAISMQPVYVPFSVRMRDPEQGYYCVANCTADMSSANWVNGQALENDTVRVPMTFKYFQTTRARPSAKKFSVRFTLTVNIP